MFSTDATGPLPQRHARVWLDPATWRSHLRVDVDQDALEALDDWIARGRAVVARRREPAHEAGPDAMASVGSACFVGVALPPAAGKRRVAFVVDLQAVVRVAPALRLDEVIDRAPADWRIALHDLARRGGRIDTCFGVYGSLAWQAIAGEAYVGPTSDVDLLWTAAGDDAIRRVLRLLVDWEADHGLRADGELLLADGDGIAWRELLGGARRVIVKHQDRVSLQPSPLVPARDVFEAPTA